MSERHGKDGRDRWEEGGSYFINRWQHKQPSRRVKMWERNSGETDRSLNVRWWRSEARVAFSLRL